jgi:hypothetical protein
VLQRGERQHRIVYFALAGLLAAIAYQFRPNLVLFPAFIAASYLLFRSFSRVRPTQIAVFRGLRSRRPAWIIRSYR